MVQVGRYYYNPATPTSVPQHKYVIFPVIAKLGLYSPTILNPLPDNKILDWSKMKQIADNILKCI